MALLALRTYDSPQTPPKMAEERALYPAVAHGGSGPLPHWSACFDWPAGYPRLSQIGLQAGYLVVCRVRLLGLFSSPKFEQALYRPTHKRQRRMLCHAWTRGSHRNLTSSGNLRTIKGASMRFGVWDPHGNPGRRPKDRAAAVRGHPHENPRRRPKNRAEVVAVLL